MINVPPTSVVLPVDDDTAAWPSPWRNWLTQAWQILVACSQSGTTANRPTTLLYTGRVYFDTTLGYPIWWDSAQWVDATGTPA